MVLNKTSLLEFLEHKHYPRAADFNEKVFHASDLQFARNIVDIFENQFIGRTRYARKVLIGETIAPKQLYEVDKRDSEQIFLFQCKESLPKIRNLTSYELRRTYFGEFLLLLSHLDNITLTLSHIFECLETSENHLKCYNLKRSVFDVFMIFLWTIEANLKNMYSCILLTKNPKADLLLKVHLSAPKPINEYKHHPIDLFNTDVFLNTNPFIYEHVPIHPNISKIECVHKDIMDKLRILSSETTSHINK